MHKLSGFTGSSGTLWVGLEDIALFTDGRYLLQAEKECKDRACVYEYDALYHHIQSHSRVVLIDPWQVSKEQEETMCVQYAPCEVRFKKLFSFTQEPAQTLFNLPALGRSSQSWKKWFQHPILVCNSQDLSFLCRLGTKNTFLPTLQGYGLGWWDNALQGIQWLIGVDAPIIEKESLPPSITCLPLECWKRIVTEKFSKVYYIPKQTPLGLLEWFPQGYVMEPWNLQEKRCIKTQEELDAIRQAHILEGVAFIRFLYWIETQGVTGNFTEYDASVQLEIFRRDSPYYQGPSFPTISAAGPFGAMIHYIPLPEGKNYIQNGPYLIDAGGQYYWGTTDMMRSVWLGLETPDSLYQEDYTQVLQGHIDVAMGTFPKGTNGCVLDTLARNALWGAHKNYEHATGHGVGIFSNVHEGHSA